MTTSENVKDKILTLARAGCSQSEIAKAAGVSMSTVYLICRKHQVKLTNAPAKVRKEIAAFMRESKLSISDASRVLPYSYGRIKKACEEEGVTPGASATNMNSMRILAEVIRTGLGPGSSRTVADALGVTRQRVDQVVKAATEAGLIGKRGLLKS